jgi:hypothetical protein
MFQKNNTFSISKIGLSLATVQRRMILEAEVFHHYGKLCNGILNDMTWCLRRAWVLEPKTGDRIAL